MDAGQLVANNRILFLTAKVYIFIIIVINLYNNYYKFRLG
jgi:hypothetical protein